MTSKPTFAKICIIVDAYSSGRVLPEEFHKLGYRCVHVISTPNLPEYYRPLGPKQEFIDATYVFDGELQTLVDTLKPLQPEFVIPGTEIGVELADRLSEAIGNVPTNGTLKSPARRNKYLMAETLRAAGVPAVRQLLSGDVQQIMRWVDDLDSWPIVIKPVNSAMADGLHIARSKQDIKSALGRLLSATNRLGSVNEQVLVQEYLQGTEFMVNTVSWGGHHFVTDIWRSQKRFYGSTKIYDFEDLVSAEDPDFALLAAYISRVLDALGIQYGPGHSEVMLTPNGPVLIETGARLCGGLPASVGRETAGVCQLDLTVQAYATRGRSERFESGSDAYRLQKHSRCITLIAPFDGKVTQQPDFSAIQSLKSFHSLSSSLKIGDAFQKTIDLATTPGIVFLIHRDPAQVIKDYARLRVLENSGLYQFVTRSHG